MLSTRHSNSPILTKTYDLGNLSMQTSSAGLCDLKKFYAPIFVSEGVR